MKIRWPIHPILIAVYPLVSLYAHNMALIPVEDLARPAVVLVAVAIITTVVLALLFWNLRSGAAAASVLLMAFLTMGHLWGIAESRLPLSRDVFSMIWMGTAALIAGVLGARARKRDPTGWMNVAAAALTIMAAITIGQGWLRIRADVKGLEAGKTGTGTAQAGAPDVFYVILDGYGRSDQLQRVIRFNNSSFINELKKRGFFVATDSHSNYCQTELSLASSLNMDFVQNLLPDIAETTFDRAPLDVLIDRSRVSEEFRAKGYTYLSVTSGFPALHFSSADLQYANRSGLTLLEQSMVALTPISLDSEFFTTQTIARRASLHDAFADLRALAARSLKPKFCVIHVLAPHPPFVIGPSGEPVKQHGIAYGFFDGSHYMAVGGTPATYRSGYSGQAAWVSMETLRAVDTLLSVDPKPIVMIQGDHGSKLGLDQDLVKRTDVHECFGNLYAVLAPEPVKRRLYSTITPVNTFRIVLSTLFGEKYKLLPDRSWFSGWDTPYKFEDVTSALAHEGNVDAVAMHPRPSS